MNRRQVLFGAGATAMALGGFVPLASAGPVGEMPASAMFLPFSMGIRGNYMLNGTAVLRGKLVGEALTETQVIWRQTPKVKSDLHFGSRLVFDGKGHLFITTGERSHFSEMAQKLDNTFGKTIRIHPDGTIPKDNPFVNTSGALPEIWSYGHRNMQGAFLHPETGELWTMEHGPRGGDEINLDLPGKNYGWPVITYGINYNGDKVGEGITEKEGMEQPLHMWNPSIAPSNMIYYTGDLFPQWKGKVFVGAMAHKYLGMLTVEGTKIVSEEKLLVEEGERIRDVAQGPDGAIYVFFDSDYARILRLVPA